MNRFVSKILDIIYPRWCRVCGKPVDGDSRFFCVRCLSDIKPLTGPICSVCGIPFPDGAGVDHPCRDCLTNRPPFDRARAAGVFGGTLRKAIHLFKYGHARSLAGYLGGMAGEVSARDLTDVDIVVPVPLHVRRLRDRGFNQSLLLAARVAERLGAGLSVDGLVRTRHTSPQLKLGREEREQNVRGAFAAAAPYEFAGRRVLLVDDVYTTGATIRECARVLKGAGADTVDVLTVARAVI